MKTSENNTNQKQPPFLSSVGIIHLEHGGSFTEDDAKLNKKLVSQEAYPWLYDLHNNPESCLYLKNDGYDLIDSSAIYRGDTGTNTAWEGDANPEGAKIAASMKRGFKLKYPPVAVVEDARITSSRGMPILIDRRTTDSILVGNFVNGKSVGDGFGYKNLIADVYGVKNTPNPATGLPWTEEEILDEISIFGQAADIQNDDPKGKMNKISIHKEFVRIYRNKLASGKYPHIFDSENKPLHSVVEARLNRVMGNSGFGPKERQELCYEIINQFEPEGTVKAWKSVAQAKNWLTTGGRNYKNIKPEYDDKGKLLHKGIIYLTVGSSQYRSAIVLAASTWNENQDYIIRVIIETEILTGYSLTNTYWKRLRTFREYWYSTLNLLSSAYFGDEGPFFRNIVLYGAIPAYKPIHDLEKLIVSVNVEESEDSKTLDTVLQLPLSVSEDVSDDDKMSNDESKHWKQK